MPGETVAKMQRDAATKAERKDARRKPPILAGSGAGELLWWHRCSDGSMTYLQLSRDACLHCGLRLDQVMETQGG